MSPFTMRTARWYSASARATARDASAGSISTSTSPVLTDWVSATCTALTGPFTSGVTWATSAPT
jgi:hypothetical protein